MHQPTDAEARRALAKAIFETIYLREWRSLEDAEQDPLIQEVIDRLTGSGFVIQPHIPAGPRSEDEDGAR